MPSGFPLTYKNITCKGYCWEAKEPSAVVVLIHGIGEHACRYDDIAAYFNAKGFEFYSFDLPGHGQSPYPRGHIGTRDEVKGLIDAMIRYARKQRPGIPVCIYGYSLGGNLALKYRLDSGDDSLLYIVTAPWLILASPPSKALLAVSKILARLAPRLPVSIKLKVEDLAPDESMVSAYTDDPLAHGKISALTGVDRLADAAEVLSRAGEKRPPLLLMQGDKDRICSIEGSRRFSAEAGDFCTYIEWQGCMHELHNDFEKEKVLLKMTSWLAANIKKRP